MMADNRQEDQGSVLWSYHGTGITQALLEIDDFSVRILSRKLSESSRLPFEFSPENVRKYVNRRSIHLLPK